MGVVDQKTRSRMMAGVRTKHTAPELAVRRLAHRLGYRFRLHRRDLPGTPDLVLPKHRTAVQVNGCFWHGHEGCRFAVAPRSNGDFWRKKIDANRSRDARTTAELEAKGWTVITIWECEVAHEVLVAERLAEAVARRKEGHGTLT